MPASQDQASFLFSSVPSTVMAEVILPTFVWLACRFYVCCPIRSVWVGATKVVITSKVPAFVSFPCTHVIAPAHV